MAERKFKFISPGVFVKEIDNSQTTAVAGPVGPVIIGKSQKGPGMKPITVSSFADFVEIFGNPVAGNAGEDIWRDSSLNAPTYGAYAAQAWLDSSSPVTYVRLMGEEDPSATTSDLAAGGYAGWRAGNMESTNVSASDQGGAWGLVVFPSGSLNETSAPALTGALAAVMYCATGRIAISGTTAGALSLGGSSLTASACELYASDSNGNLTLYVQKDGTDTTENVSVSLNPASSNYIRNVLNTNPTITNSTITPDSARSASQGGNFWLGETFERSLASSSQESMGILDGGNASSFTSVLTGPYHAAILPLRNQEDDDDNTLNDRRFAATRASTGYYFSQDLSTATASYDPKSMQTLFRFEALSAGAELQKEIKITIENIKAPQGAFEDYGTFSVLVRSMNDTDANQVVLERYDGVNLNPASPNYIAALIGDQFEKYDSTTQTNRLYGEYPNLSKYIRVEVDEAVSRGGLEPRYLPFGVFGPLQYRNAAIISGSDGFSDPASPEIAARGAFATMLDGGNSARFSDVGGNPDAADSALFLGDANVSFSGAIQFPAVPLRKRSTWSNPKNRRLTYWGAWTGLSPSDQTFNEEIVDLVRPRCRVLAGPDVASYSTTHDLADLGQMTLKTSDPLQISWAFSLDNLSGNVDGTVDYLVSARTSGLSISALSGNFTSVLDAGLDRFTTVLAGGSNGYDVTERDNFRNSKITDSSTERTNSALHSLKRAINIVSDAEQVECNIISLPGVTNIQATNHLLDIAEERGDTLAVVDLPFVYTADTESSASAEDRNNFTIKQAVDSLKGRNINNSYGAAYYPWVRITDTISNRTLWAPPSVAAMGALSNTDRIAAPWFAPAGFTRGGLSEGAAGIPVVDTSRRLTSDDRDDLYEAGINPIAKFPAEGIVIFGQKTLQQTASALDRINVRRLMIFLKREISFIASRLLFAPNTRDTWTRFTQQATPVLESVKTQFGIEDFRLILDESTTTPDLIDRNIIYAKLIVKPTRSAEFFAIDFVITNSGAGFED